MLDVVSSLKRPTFKAGQWIIESIQIKNFYVDVGNKLHVDKLYSLNCDFVNFPKNETC